MRFLALILTSFLLTACLDNKGVTIENAYSFATAPTAKNGAIFMIIKNHGEADRLVQASSDVAARVEIHEMSMDGGTMKMRAIDALDLPANGSAELAPHGYHIMLFDLKEPLAEGETFNTALRFEKAGEKIVSVKIVKAGQQPETSHGHAH